jgi:uncharacterized membrane protein YagU involved in acid resistance
MIGARLFPTKTTTLIEHKDAMMFRRTRHRNPWKGLIVGVIGGAAGVLAMSAYWQTVTALLGHDPRKQPKRAGAPMPLDNISLVGTNHYPDESSTAALGRIVYRASTGNDPNEQTKTLMSYLMHWLISASVSGAYGMLREGDHSADNAVEGGLVMGTGLWLLGDEVLMPLLGLTDGPTAYPSGVHVHGFGAHIAFGVTAAAVAAILDSVLEYGALSRA